MIYSTRPDHKCLNALKPQQPSDERWSKLFCKGAFKGIILSEWDFSMLGYYGDFHIFSLPWVFPFFNIKDCTHRRYLAKFYMCFFFHIFSLNCMTRQTIISTSFFSSPFFLPSQLLTWRTGKCVCSCSSILCVQVLSANILVSIVYDYLSKYHKI